MQWAGNQPWTFRTPWAFAFHYWLGARSRSAIVVLSGICEEGLEILAHDFIKDRFGRTAREVGRGECGHEVARIAVRVPSASREISFTRERPAPLRTVWRATGDTSASLLADAHDESLAIAGIRVHRRPR